jgi:hypothetical protein
MGIRERVIEKPQEALSLRAVVVHVICGNALSPAGVPYLANGGCVGAGVGRFVFMGRVFPKRSVYFRKTEVMWRFNLYEDDMNRWRFEVNRLLQCE